MKVIRYKPIGIIYSPFKTIKGVPIQPSAVKNTEGRIEIMPQYAGGLKDIDGFSHLILIYHFHLSRGFSLKVRPFLDDKLHGLFSTRIPRRPNSIGVSVVRLVKVKDCTLYIKGVDIVNKTPLLDIKPYVPQFDLKKVEKIGWLKNKIDKLPNKRS